MKFIEDQDGLRHLKWAETLRFTYPVTVTFVQFLGTLCILHLAGYIIETVARYGPEYRWDSRRTSSSPQNLHKRFLPVPAILLLAEAILGSWMLFQSPIELYILSRALAVPIALVFARLLLRLGALGYAMPDRGTLWTSLTLSASTILVSYRPELLQYSTKIGIAINSSLGTALGVLALQHAGQLLGSFDHTPLIMDNTGDFIHKTETLLMRIHSQLEQLKHMSLMAVLVMLSILLFSGELGQISRNCYFLDESRFYKSLLLSAVSRCVVFSSTVLLVQETSAHTTLFVSAFMTAAMLPLFRSWDLLPSQVVGLVGCFVAAGAFLFNAYGHMSAKASVDSVHTGKWLKRLRFPSRWTVFVFAGIGCTTIIILAWNTKEAPSTSSFLPLAQSKTGYLGSRPHSNTYTNFTRMLTNCRGEKGKYILDFAHCLDYLDNEQKDYLFLPENTPSGALPRQRDDAANRSTTDLSSSREFDKTRLSCDGPIIPYHIWWTGPPSLRMELFIKSYLFTQNLPCSVLFIWINTDQDPRHALAAWTSNERFQLLFQPLLSSGSIILKPWTLPSRVPLPPLEDQDELDIARNYASPGKPIANGEVKIADSVIRDATGQLWLELYPPSQSHQIKYFTVAASDAARLIILHLYGGVYTDVDMLLLRDLRPLLLPQLGFAERWGDHEFYNNALVSLPANSSISSYLLRGGARSGLQFHFVALSRMMRKEKRDDGNKGGLIMLENGFFDPATAWFFGKEETGRCTVPCILDFGDVFKALPIDEEWSGFHGERIEGVPEGGNNRTLQNFFRGAWAYHIHNQVSFCFLNVIVLIEALTVCSGVRRSKPGVGCMSFLRRMMRILVERRIIYTERNGWARRFQNMSYYEGV